MKVYAVAVLVVLAGFVSHCGHGSRNKESDALWRIVSQQCLPKGEYINQKVNPCIHVDTSEGEKKGHVVFKDRVGVLQYLLMPTDFISGIESPKLLKDDTPNFIYLSWQARLYMERKMRMELNPQHVSLAINSQFGRTQNHLHVHISCIRPDVKKVLDSNAESFKDQWSLLDFKINGHTYWAKKVSETQLAEMNVFKNMADEISGAANSLGEFGLGLAVIADKKNPEGYALILLASRREASTSNKGSVEEIQDHECRAIFPL